jgi:hypothetical protein
VKATQSPRRIPAAKRPAAIQAVKAKVQNLLSTFEPESVRLAAAQRRREDALRRDGVVDE